MKILQLTAAVAMAMSATHAWAADDDATMSYPSVSGELSFELGYDNTYNSGDPTAELSDLYPTIEADLNFNFSENLLVHSHFVFESVLDPTDDRIFGDLGLYASELYIQLQLDPFTIVAGKFAPTFGTAWDVTPGIYGADDLAGDYEIDERIGFSLGTDFGEEGAGVHHLQGNAFFVDTTFLSDSIGTSRGPATLADGGASNTESLESFSVTIDGSEFDAMPGFSYHLGLSLQAKGVGDVDDEFGVVGGFQKEIEIDDDHMLTFTGEFAHLSHAGAGPDDASYATAGLGYTFGQWNVAAATTHRWTDVAGGTSARDYQVSASIGYEFENGVALDFGYKFLEDGGVDNHTVGFRLGKAIEF